MINALGVSTAQAWPVLLSLCNTSHHVHATICMPQYACLQMHVTVCMPPYACHHMHASICMSPHACHHMHAFPLQHHSVFFLIAYDSDITQTGEQHRHITSCLYAHHECRMCRFPGTPPTFFREATDCFIAKASSALEEKATLKALVTQHKYDSTNAQRCLSSASHKV